MGVDEFYDMLPREFWNKVEGFYEVENLRQRHHWERTRWSTCLLLNIHIPKGKTVKPKDLIKFDWEKQEGEEDLQKLKDRANYFRKLNEHKKIKKKDGK